MIPNPKRKPFYKAAVQFIGGKEDAAELIRWIRSKHGSAQWIGASQNQVEVMGLRTLFGVDRVYPGDWIVQGIEGDFYRVTSAVFTKVFL